MNNAPIGVFDSGVGGLTVLRQLLLHLPDEQMIYLGDTARLPYGTKSAETVVRYSLNNAAFLSRRNIKLLVVACNTASALALDALRERFRIPILGVIDPGARKAASGTRFRRVGVIGTQATVQSGAYEQAILRHAGDVHVRSIACPLFVGLAEEGWTDDEITRQVAERYLEPLRSEHVDMLVLGCTHYPLLKGVLSRVVGEGIQLVDSAEEVAMEVAASLGENGLRADPERGKSETAPRIYLTDCSPHFLRLGERILGRLLEGVEYVDVGG